MAEVDPNHTTQSEEKPAYTPASLEKRIAAWVGIVYALMFCFIISFSMYCPDRSLAGTFPLFLVPVAVGVLVISICKQCRGTARGGLPTTIFVVILCLAAAAFGLLLGAPALCAALGG